MAIIAWLYLLDIFYYNTQKIDTPIISRWQEVLELICIAGKIPAEILLWIILILEIKYLKIAYILSYGKEIVKIL